MRKPTLLDVAIGKNIRMYRVRRGLSQFDLGRHLGVTQQQIQLYEKGGNRPSSGTLAQIAVVLGVSLPLLFEGGPTTARALLAKKHSVRLVQAFDKVPTERMRMMILRVIEAIGNASRGRWTL